MNIPVWNGSSHFSPGQTPFGFYDNDLSFVSEIDKVSGWCAKRLGYPIVEVELESGSFYAAFEEAITAYGNEVYQYKIRENYLSMEGNSTGSVLNNQLITPSLGGIIRLAKTYGSEAGSGGNVTYHTGSIDLKIGQQDYDLNLWASEQGFTSSIEIKRIYYEAPPAIVRYFDPYAGTGTGIQSLLETFGFGQYSPGINFLLMPIYFDVQKIQAIEFNDQIRKSAFSFDLINNKLKIFPIPNMNMKLFFQYIFINERDSVIDNSLFPSGSMGPGSIITDISNVPYENPKFSQINSIGKQWIYQYTLAISKEMLGYIRNKYSQIPIPGSEVMLNGDTLINDARNEKERLIEYLRGTLEETSRKNQLEKKAQEAESLKNQLNNIPLGIYVF